MKGFYSKRAKGKFKDLLEGLEKRDSERASLAGEVDLARGIAEQASTLLSAAIEQDAEKHLIFAAARFAQDALQHVSGLVSTMVKVQMMDRSTLDAEQVDHILTQVSEIIENFVEDEGQKAKVVEFLGRIKVPDRKTNFTISVT